MNSTKTNEDWDKIKSKIASKWSRFGPSDIEGFKGNMDSIAGKIQKTYGYSKEKSEQEYREFKKMLDSKDSKTRM